ncbi:MAG: Crp/Fnr family transcriptional regulator [Clostridia bacterium]|nr:Crp/Fnr family transcriptional regulator [Clostridia bacterium]
MNEKEILACLETVPLFSHVFLSALPEIIVLSAGDTYEIKRGLAVFVKGKAEIFKKDAFLKTVFEPTVIGLATLFDKTDAYISTLIAKSETTLLLFSEKNIEQLISESPEFSKRLIVLLSEKLRYLNRRIDFYTTSGAEGKLHTFLLSSAGEHGFVELPMTRLSEILDIGRASLYRALNSLEENGYIKKQGKKIFLIK